MNVYVRALGVPNICSSIYGQRIDIAKTEHPFLNDLMLANDRNNLEEYIDLLIGADLYWTLVEDKIIRDDNSGLVVIQSKLGWLISGPVEHEKYEFEKDKNMV